MDCGEGLNCTSHVMTAAPGAARIHIGCEIQIKTVGFYLVEQRARVYEQHLMSYRLYALYSSYKSLFYGDMIATLESEWCTLPVSVNPHL